MRHTRKLKRMGDHLRACKSTLKYYDAGFITAGWIRIYGRGNPVNCLGRFELLLHIARTKENMRKVLDEATGD